MNWNRITPAHTNVSNLSFASDPALTAIRNTSKLNTSIQTRGWLFTGQCAPLSYCNRFIKEQRTGVVWSSKAQSIKSILQMQFMSAFHHRLTHGEKPIGAELPSANAALKPCSFATSYAITYSVEVCHTACSVHTRHIQLTSACLMKWWCSCRRGKKWGLGGPQGVQPILGWH